MSIQNFKFCQLSSEELKQIKNLEDTINQEKTADEMIYLLAFEERNK